MTGGVSRRRFGLGTATAAAAALLTGESGYAKRFLAGSKFNPAIAWLNANENPEGPPAVSIEAMKQCLHLAGRYRDDDMNALGEQIAQLERIQPSQVLLASGSSEILNCAVVAFTSERIPVITPAPVFELPVDIAKGMGRPHVQIPLRPDYSADVEALVRESKKAGGGLVYVCNPNNPTASITSAKDLDWLVTNLPEKAVLLVDEAYIHFDPAIESAMKHVQSSGRNVIVARTFSKIYGMAGLRVGFGCARVDLIKKMEQFRDNSISIPGVYAASASLADPGVVAKRRARYNALRKDFVSFLDRKGLKHIPSHANFVMFDTRKPVRDVIFAMRAQGVEVGRPFPPYDTMLRVTLGTPQEMDRCIAALSKTLATTSS
jgi:histidinol-phosphate aminotransferase